MPLRLLPATLALGLFWPLPSHACDTPKIKVVSQYAAPWTTYLPIAALNAKYRKKGEHIWLGSTSTRLQAEVSLSSGAKGGTFSSCVSPGMQITISLSEHEVTLAEEIKALPCIHKTVREHEGKHVALNKRMLHEMNPIITSYANKRLPMVLQNVPQEAQLDAMQLFVASELQAAIDHARDRFSAQQAAIDSPEEYNRLRTACKMEMASLNNIVAPLEKRVQQGKPRSAR